jgi:hypothetical protein
VKTSTLAVTTALIMLSPKAFASNPFALGGAAETATDILILGTAIGDLANEIGVSAELLQELNAVREESRLVRDQIYLTRTITQEAYGLSNPKISSSGKLAYEIDSVTRYIRRAKNLGSLILRLGGRPEAATAASLQETNHLLFMLLQNQERAALAQEREKVSKEREELSRTIAFAKFIDDETKDVNDHAERMSRERASRRRGFFRRS